jgi:hypothetical protein
MISDLRFWQSAIRNPQSAIRNPAAWWLWGIVVTLLGSVAVWACDTPVYLYTLQNWQTDPYPVYYFYRETEAPRDAAVNRHLDTLATGLNAHANLTFARIDVSRLESSGTSSDLQRVWARHKADLLPFHVVLTPRGTELFAGRLDLAAVRSLVGSPKRTQLARQLCQKKQGVLLLLQGSKQAENAAAEKVVRQAVADAQRQGQDVGFLTVSRKDPQERWFVPQLFQVEDDLKGLDHAMVFGVFGRGYVMPPCVGKGITERNVAGLVEFINGPCSCEIKAANPGLDLLTDWDWEAHLPDLPEYTEMSLNSMLFDVNEAPSDGPDAPGREQQVPGTAQAMGTAQAIGTAQATGTAQRPFSTAGGGKSEAQPEKEVPAAKPPRAERLEKKPSAAKPPPTPGEKKRGEGLKSLATRPGGKPAEAGSPGSPVHFSGLPSPAGVDRDLQSRPSGSHDPRKTEAIGERKETTVAGPPEAEGNPGPSTSMEVERSPVLPISTGSRGTPAEAEDGEAGPSLASTLAQQLGLALSAAFVLVVVIGLVVLRRRKEK